jgi:ribosomal protein S18 acetylase RimI-like enzyme
MRFDLDEILIDDILFHMENQEGDFLLDVQEGRVIDLSDETMEDDEENNSERYITLPEWSPNDGYRLMEKFAAGLKSPVVRQELSAALNRNKGVFRAYRDVLGQYPEIGKQWFKYKEQQMTNEVIAWYNSKREEWGLKPFGSEPEDNFLLVLEDFVTKEQLTENKEQVIINFTSETAAGDTVGNISAELVDGVLHIRTLEVKPEYQGMGIGKTLLAKLLEKADKKKVDVTIDLPVEADFFSRSLYLEEFKPCFQRFIRKPSRIL